MPDKWYETAARSSCTGVSLRWVAGAVDDTLIHVLSGAIEVTALKYGHVPRAVGIRMHLSGFGRTAAHAPAFSGAHYVASSDGEVGLREGGGRAAAARTEWQPIVPQPEDADGRPRRLRRADQEQRGEGV